MVVLPTFFTYTVMVLSSLDFIELGISFRLRMAFGAGIGSGSDGCTGS